LRRIAGDFEKATDGEDDDDDDDGPDEEGSAADDNKEPGKRSLLRIRQLAAQRLKMATARRCSKSAPGEFSSAKISATKDLPTPGQHPTV
jgi:TATA-binding protein-associated factor Taf7